jgi:TRAP-type C4-dicarboxylate transport system permease small subunit
MRNALRLLGRVEAAFGMASAILLFAVMLIVASDVAMRYAFNRPFSWSYDLVSLYLMLAIFYFALSRTFALNAHVGVDILHYYVSTRVRRAFELIICLISAPVFALVTLACMKRAATSFADADVLSGAIAWPTWASIALAPLGAGLLALRLLVDAACHAVALSGGPELIPLPGLARTGEGEEALNVE